MTEAERAGHRVRTIHKALTGTDADGTRYQLDEPDLLLWVHCGEVSSCAEVARRSGCRSPPPTSTPNYEQIRPRLYAGDEAIQALRVIMLPPAPNGNRGLKLGMTLVSALAFSTLPGWARHMYGRSGGPLSEAAATAGLVAVRLMLSQQRLFSGAMRAVHRAESAGDILR
jgi:uncharacterized protein (DUF2236 family)